MSDQSEKSGTFGGKLLACLQVLWEIQLCWSKDEEH